MKARISPHVIEDLVCRDLRSDCAMCGPPVGMCIRISPATLFGWPLHKPEVNAVLLQTGSAARDVYMLPPRQSIDRGEVLWLLLTVAYGIFNEISKWQAMRDEHLLSIGLEPAPLMPQLLVMRNDGHMIATVAKLVDNILSAGLEYIVPAIIVKIDARFTLGTIVHSPCALLFSVINLLRHEDITVDVNASDTLNGRANMLLC